MNEKQKILNRIDFRAYYGQFIPDHHPTKDEVVIGSPFRKDNHPSFSINLKSGLWHDFATNEGGDIFTFEERLSQCDFKQALQNLARFASLEESSGPPMMKTEALDRKKPISLSVIENWTEALFSYRGQAARQYLNSRGLSDEILRQYQIGFDAAKEAVVIPLALSTAGVTSLKRYYFEAAGWKLIDGKKKVTTVGPAVLFPAPEEIDPIIICEGELDCLLLRQHGFNAVTGTAGAATWKSHWNASFKDRDVVIIYDSDAAGRKGAEAVSRQLLKIAHRVRKVDLYPKRNDTDGGDKDITDFFASGGTPEQLRNLIESAKGLELAAEVAPQKSADDEDFVDRSPSQNDIAASIARECDLFFSAGSFYFYEKGVWKKDRSRMVDREIKTRLARRANRSMIESIRFLLTIDCHIDWDSINSNRMLINFQNGMFDLASCTLLPHDKSYRSTIQLPITYDANATAERWGKFLTEIFEGDESLEMLLQEIFGYILVPDFSKQKAFWFYGPGANGKGVVIRILEALIDKSNRTAIDLKNLSSPFVRASLAGKLLSVQGDFPPRLFGNEFWLKLVIGGDTIDAQEKYGAQFEFTPYARFIFAMNTLPETKDKTHGFYRRFIILPFNRIFKEAEQDKQLYEKLEKELPGIFNWAVEGLKRLVTQNTFTEPERSRRAIEQYRSESNTVGDFVETCCVLGEEERYTADEFWHDYETFCAEEGVEPVPRRLFAMQARRNYNLSVKSTRAEGRVVRAYHGIGKRNG